MRKLLVLRGGALGDFIVTLPALAALRRHWPDAKIELAGNATAATLARDAKLIDAVHSQHEARWSALFSIAPLPGEFSAWLASFDLVLNFWPDDSGELARHFPLRPEQRFSFASAQPVLAPAAAHFCAALAPLGIGTIGNFYSLATQSGPDLRPDAFIAVHPGSGSVKKNWPLDRWFALCDWLQREQHANLLVITGVAESDATRALARFGTPAHNLPLSDLAARLAQCRLFIGHDSGISHLAAACGTPGVLLFGPSDPAMWAPPVPQVRVLRRGPEVAAVGLDDVKREISLVLAGPSPAAPGRSLK